MKIRVNQSATIFSETTQNPWFSSIAARNDNLEGQTLTTKKILKFANLMMKMMIYCKIITWFVEKSDGTKIVLKFAGMGLATAKFEVLRPTLFAFFFFGRQI